MDILSSAGRLLIEAYERLFGDLANANVSLVILLVAMAALIAARLVIFRVDRLLSRSSRLVARSGRVDAFAVRMGRQADVLRGTGTWSERMAKALYRDGSADSMVEEGDFLLFVRFAVAFLAFVFSLVVFVVLIVPAWIFGMVVIAFFGPLVWARRHNKVRRQAIEEQMPAALSRIEVRMSSDASLQDAFAKTAELMEGPIAGELAWAARRMRDAVDELEVLKELDEHAHITLFTPIADQLALSRRTSRVKMREMFSSIVERRAEQEFDEISERIEKVKSTITRYMAVPLILAVILSVAAPFIVTLITGDQLHPV